MDALTTENEGFELGLKSNNESLTPSPKMSPNAPLHTRTNLPLN